MKKIIEMLQQVNDFRQQGQLEKALEAAQIASDLLRESLGEKDPLYIFNLGNLAYLYHATGQFKQAEPLYLRAIKEMRNSFGSNNGYLAENLNNLALLYRESGRLKDAEPLFQEAIRITAETSGKNSSGYASGLCNLALLYSTMGLFNKAEPLYVESMAITQAVEGCRNSDYAHTLDNLAAIYRVTGRLNEAESLYQEALEIRKEVLGEEDPGYARSLNNLAILYQDTGRIEEAETFYLKAVDINLEALGDKHPGYGSAINDLAVLYKETGRYEEAEALYMEALAITRDILGDKNPDVALYLFNLANLCHFMGRYDDAEAYHLKAIDIRREVLGENNHEYAYSLNKLARLYCALGRLKEARQMYLKALKIIQETLGEMTPQYAMNLGDLAVLYLYMGQMEEAENMLLEAAKIRCKTQGKRNNEYAKVLNNLALLYYNMGKYEDADKIYREALEITGEVMGERHSDYATTLNGLAMLYQFMGNYSEAEELYQETLRIKCETLGEMHPEYATVLSNLGIFYHLQGRYQEAETKYMDALKIRHMILSHNHPDYGTSINNLAALYLDLGRHEDAKPLFLEAQRIISDVPGKEHPQYATVLFNLARLYESEGRFTDAEPLYLEVSEIFLRTLGGKHPDYALALCNLACVKAALGNYNEALAYFEKSTELNNNLLLRLAVYLTEQQLLTFAGKLEKETYSLLSLVWRYLKNNREAVRLALDTVLRRKAIVYETVAAQHNLALSGKYTQLKEAFTRLRQVRTRLARLILGGPDDSESQEQYDLMLAKLEDEQDMLEQEIAKQVPLMELQLRMQNAGIEEIAKALPKGSVLVEIIRFTPYNFKDFTGAEQQGTDRYAAFMMMDSEPGQIEMVDLGEAAEIEKLINDFGLLFVSDEETRGVKNISTEVGELREVCRNLYDTIFQPLICKLQDKKLPDDLVQIIIAPDGELFRVPFEAFLSPQDRFVVEDFELSYVTVGRDLVRSGEINTDGEAVVVADPDYNLVKSEELEPDGERTEQSDDGSQQRSYLHRQLRSSKKYFDLLPGTRAEGNSLVKMLNLKGIKTTTFFGNMALERLVKTIEQPLVLHIATHGFYFSEQDKPVGQQYFGLIGREVENTAYCFKKYFGSREIENPFLRSGIALAGVNTVFSGGQVPDDAEDGIITALDVLTLNLMGTELVTLSACQTGLGEICCGEGVAGLRKSFVLAGAKTLVVSLWSVPDYETRWLMEEFYRRILEGEDKSKALRKSKLKLIENLRKKGGFADPWYWAGFICQGDTGPLV
jgi:tetratricopeptide (TPR) repeat protein/CHAT domain-containing protein